MNSFSNAKDEEEYRKHVWDMIVDDWEVDLVKMQRKQNFHSEEFFGLLQKVWYQDAAGVFRCYDEN